MLGDQIYESVQLRKGVDGKYYYTNFQHNLVKNCTDVGLRRGDDGTVIRCLVSSRNLSQMLPLPPQQLQAVTPGGALPPLTPRNQLPLPLPLPLPGTGPILAPPRRPNDPNDGSRLAKRPRTGDIIDPKQGMLGSRCLVAWCPMGCRVLCIMHVLCVGWQVQASV